MLDAATIASRARAIKVTDRLEDRIGRAGNALRHCRLPPAAIEYFVNRIRADKYRLERIWRKYLHMEGS
jgi:hypothetical protein